MLFLFIRKIEKKGVRMKYFKRGDLKENQHLKNYLKRNWLRRMNSLEKKMTRGSQNIYRMIKTRFKWGNKDFPGKKKDFRFEG